MRLHSLKARGLAYAPGKLGFIIILNLNVTMRLRLSAQMLTQDGFDWPESCCGIISKQGLILKTQEEGSAPKHSDPLTTVELDFHCGNFLLCEICNWENEIAWVIG